MSEIEEVFKKIIFIEFNDMDIDNARYGRLFYSYNLQQYIEALRESLRKERGLKI